MDAFSTLDLTLELCELIEVSLCLDVCNGGYAAAVAEDVGAAWPWSLLRVQKMR